MAGLKKANIEIDRKVLADLAVLDKPAFADRRKGQGRPGLKPRSGGLDTQVFCHRDRPVVSGATTTMRWHVRPPQRLIEDDLDEQPTMPVDAWPHERPLRPPTPADLENAKARYPRQAGELTELMKGMGALSPEEKKSRGAQHQHRQSSHRSGAERRREELADAELEASACRAQALDVTLPGRARGRGGVHPITRTWGASRHLRLDRLRRRRRSGDRDRLDKLHRAEQPGEPPGALDAGHLLRRHEGRRRPLADCAPTLSPCRCVTPSACQKACRCERMPDIKVIAPGRTYRVDSDATHSPMFHQCEGLWIGENISFTDLKSVFTSISAHASSSATTCRCAFGPATSPSPNLGRDRHAFADGPLKGRWLEVAGSGQVHPQGGAQFRPRPRALHRLCVRLGPERLTMLRYGHDDLRLFFDGDLRFLGNSMNDGPDMKFPESWLREWCNPPLSSQALADTLTMGGFEVESMAPSHRRSAAWWSASPS